MAIKRQEVHIGSKDEGQKTNNVDVDLISKLPDHVTHRILSFLPTHDSVRMSLLSKCWRQIWYLVPAVDFTYKSTESVAQYLKHRKMGMHHDTSFRITRFKLMMRYNGESSKMDSWLDFAGQPRLQELCLQMEKRDG